MAHASTPAQIGVRASLCLVAMIATSCASNDVYEVDLMPIPDAFDETVGEDKERPSYVDLAPYDGLLYVTDRAPSEADDKERFYKTKRGSTLRVGLAQVAYSGKPRSAEELRDIALAKTGTTNFPLAVTELEELGFLSEALPYDFLTGPEELAGTSPADEEFAALVNKKLAISKDKDVYIYVHGYKVIFENPLLVSAQLWHFMGYEGVFMSFAWPSTPKRLAYFKDIETAELSAHNLRLFLEFLMEHTDAEKIHVIGYSAGTRVVIAALHQLALLQARHPSSRSRIGQAVLVGSDYDRQRWAAAVVDGLLDVPETLAIYVSPTDKALGFSRFIFREGRLGQSETAPVSETVRNWLASNDRLFFIDVSGAAGSASGNGHAYFRSSPWVSSDLLASLLYELTPAERGLVRLPDALSWSFPSDYHLQLGAAIREQRRQETPAVMGIKNRGAD